MNTMPIQIQHAITHGLVYFIFNSIRRVFKFCVTVSIERGPRCILWSRSRRNVPHDRTATSSRVCWEYSPKLVVNSIWSGTRPPLNRQRTSIPRRLKLHYFSRPTEIFSNRFTSMKINRLRKFKKHNKMYLWRRFPRNSNDFVLVTFI